MVDRIIENRGIYIHNPNDMTEITVKENLKVGRMYSSWNEIYLLIGSELLGQKTLKGGKQKSHAKRYLLQYANFVSAGKKRFVVCTEIYDIPHYDDSVTLDNRGKSGAYIDRMLPVYIYHLLQQEKNEWFTFLDDIAKTIGLVSTNYKTDKSEDMEKINSAFSMYMVNACYSQCNEHLQCEVFLLLDRLQKEYKVLEYERKFRILTAEGEHISNKEEEKIIIEAENEVLTEMNLANKKIVFWKNWMGKFYGRVYEIINQKFNFNWKRYYKQIHISLNRDKLNQIANGFPQDVQSIEKLREELGVLTATKIYNQIVSKYNKTRKNAVEIEKEYRAKAQELLEKERQKSGGEKPTIWDLVELKIYTKEEALEKLSEVPKEKKPFNYHESFLITQYELVTYLVAKPDVPHPEEQGRSA